MILDSRKGRAAGFGTVALACLIAACCALGTPTGAAAQQKKAKKEETLEQPRARSWLPAPGVGGRRTEQKVFDAERGTVFRYELQPGDGPATFYRDMYDLPGYGTRGSVGLKFKF